jgi:adenylate cyclase class IV
MQTYEVEIKSLLGGPERAEEMRREMKKIDEACNLISKNTQLNHYFEIDKFFKHPLHSLVSVMREHLPEHAIEKLRDLAVRASNFSLRSRFMKEGEKSKTLLVVKASVGDDTSENGIARIEFEEHFPLSLDFLNELITTNGFRYQAKWSREREEYVCRGVNVTLDKNAGYGWLAELERMVEDEALVEKARAEIQDLMRELRLEELSQDRLERMFAFYNAHWPEYYGTEKIFVIE